MRILRRVACGILGVVLALMGGGLLVVRATSDAPTTMLVLSDQAGDGRLYLTHTATGTTQRITDTGDITSFVGEADGWLYFQLSARRSAFQANLTGQLYRMRPDGSDFHQVSKVWVSLGEFIWTPDKQHLLFLGQGVNFRQSLWIMRADGSDVRNLGGGFSGYIGFNNYGPGLFFSPDGQWVAFSGRDRGAGNIGIYRVKMDGTEVRHLTEPFDGNFVIRGWPAEHWMLVVRDSVLYRLQADGSELAPLGGVADNKRADVAGWVAESEMLVASTRASANFTAGLFAMEYDEKSPKIPRWFMADTSFVSFTPDQQGVIVRTDAGTRLARMNLDGSDLTELVSDTLLERTWGFSADKAWLMYSSTEARTLDTILRRVRLRDGRIETLGQFDGLIMVPKNETAGTLIVRELPTQQGQTSRYWQVSGGGVEEIKGIGEGDVLVKWDVRVERGSVAGILLILAAGVGLVGLCFWPKFIRRYA